MPSLQAGHRVQGGKTVRVLAQRRDGKLQDIRITGDFFVHPEEALHLIESELSALAITGDEPDLEVKVRKVIEGSGAQLVGFAPEDIAGLLRSLP